MWNPYPQVVCSEGFAYARGQCAFTTAGDVIAPFDLREQIRLGVKYGLRSFAEQELAPTQFLRAVVYYDHKVGFSESQVRSMFIDALGVDELPSIILVPLNGFPEMGMVQEIDFFATTGEVDRVTVDDVSVASAFGTAFVSGVSVTGTPRGDIESALDKAREKIATVLDSAGMELDSIVKLKTYVSTDILSKTEQWQRLVELRASWFRNRYPVITDIPLSGLAEKGCDLRFDVIAKTAEAAGDYQPVHAQGTGKLPFNSPHPPALVAGKHFFVGGQLGFAPDGQIVEPGIQEYQTRTIMEAIGRLLEAAGLSFDNVIKKTTYVIGRRGHKEDLQRNFSIRASYYKNPGPASTGVFVDSLPVEGTLLTIETTAIRD